MLAEDDVLDTVLVVCELDVDDVDDVVFDEEDDDDDDEEDVVWELEEADVLDVTVVPAVSP